MGTIKRYHIVLLLMLTVVLAACRPARNRGPTPIPTNTPAPISTPLPLVPTAIPPGVAENPLKVALVAFDAEAAAEQVEALQQLILDEAGVAVEILLVERYAEALAALCSSVGQDVTAAWLDGIAYLAAEAQGCGDPVLAIVRDVDGEPSIGDTGQVIVSATFGSNRLSVLPTRTFCRLGVTDFYSWLLPLLIFEANDINSDSFAGVVDYEDTESLISAVIDGDCAGTGIASATLNQLIADDESIRDGVRVAATSAPFPYGILTMPIEVPLGTRIALINGLEAIAEDEEKSAILYPFLGQDDLDTVNVEAFAELRDFMVETGVDLAQLGN